ncbi:MAG: tyrosine-type recombinase/integrase [Acidobacteriota bacterium]
MRKKKKSADWRKQKREHAGSIRERGGKLFARIQYFGEDGKRRDKERAARNRKHARELISEMRGELKQHGETVLDAHRMTFNELSERYSKLKLIPAVIVNGKKVAGLRSLAPQKAAMSALTSRLGRKQVRTIKHSDVEEYKLERLQTPVRCGTDEDDNPIYRPRSVAAVNRELELLRAVLRFAQREGWIVKSPFDMGASLISKTSETRRDRVLSFDEEKRLLAACNNKRAHLRPLLITALDTGMRRGELFKLQWFDVDFKSNLIRVRATNTKTEQARTVGMTQRVRRELLALRKEAPTDASVSVFGIKNTVKNGFASALNEAKIENFTFHDCRHTATTRLTTSGMPAAEAMKITGHTQMVTFQRYVSVTEEAARNGAERLDAFLSARSKRSRNNVLHLTAKRS